MYVCVRSEDRAAALCQAHAVRDVAALSSPGQNDIAADSLTPFPPSRRPTESGTSLDTRLTWKKLQLLHRLAKQEETLLSERNSHLEINTIHYSS